MFEFVPEEEKAWIVDIPLDEIEDLYSIIREELEPKYVEGLCPIYFFEDEEADILYVSNIPLSPDKIIAFYENEEEEYV